MRHPRDEQPALVKCRNRDWLEGRSSVYDCRDAPNPESPMAYVNDRGGSRFGSARTDGPDDPGLTFLQCPRCGGGVAKAVDSVACRRCRGVVQAPDGIVDFVAGSSSTTLDDLGYDAFCSISESASRPLFDTTRLAAGPRWPARLGNAVEIGCGTGGFSSAVLRHTPSD